MKKILISSKQLKTLVREMMETGGEDHLMQEEAGKGLELKSVALQLVNALKKNGLQVGFEWGGDGMTMTKYQGQTSTYKDGQKQTKGNRGQKGDDVTVYVDTKNDPKHNVITVGFRNINNQAEAEFVGNFVNSVNSFLNSTPVDKSGKAKGVKMSDMLEITSPIGWPLNQIEKKIAEIIQKRGNFYSSTPIVKIRYKPEYSNRGGQGTERLYKTSGSPTYSQEDKIMGLRKGNVADNGQYDLFGTPWLITGKEEDKNAKTISILMANEKTKKVMVSNFVDYLRPTPEVEQKLKQMAQGYAKKMGFEFVDSSYQLNKSTEPTNESLRNKKSKLIESTDLKQLVKNLVKEELKKKR